VQGPERREIYQGRSDGFAKAVEIVVTPLVLGMLGHFLDGWLGTGPVLTVLLAAWGLIAVVIITYYGYEAQMKAEEDKLFGPGPRRAA
jgi:F0F1-type ATP synthase assembly protein I